MTVNAFLVQDGGCSLVVDSPIEDHLETSGKAFFFNDVSLGWLDGFSENTLDSLQFWLMF